MTSRNPPGDKGPPAASPGDPISNAIRAHVKIPEIPRLTVVDVLQWRTSPAPEVRWLISMLLAMGEAGCLVGRSNSGKGFILLMLIMAVTTGRDLFGRKGTGKPMKVLFLEMEDSPAELHRRISRLLELMRKDPTWTEQDEINLFANLVLLTPNWNSTEGKTLSALFPTLDGHISTITKAGQEVGLIVLDTLAALSEGDENAVEAQRETLAALYRLRDVTGACVLAVHHTRKTSTGGKPQPLLDRMSFDSTRGSSAIVASMRFVMQIEALTQSEALKLDLDEEKAQRGGYIVLMLSKVVSGPKGEMILLVQAEGPGGGFLTLHPNSDHLTALLRSKGVAERLNLAEAVLLSIADGCKDRKELAKRHWPEKPTEKAADALKGILNHLRHRYGWLQKGHSMDLTIQGLQKSEALRRNQAPNDGSQNVDETDEDQI